MNRFRLTLIAIAAIALAWLGWAIVTASSEPLVGFWVQSPLYPSDYEPPEIPAEFGVGSNPKLNSIQHPTHMEFRKDGTWLWRQKKKTAVATGLWRPRESLIKGELAYECVIDGEVVARIHCTGQEVSFYSGPQSSVPVPEFPDRFVRPGNFLIEIPGRLRNWVERTFL